MFPQALQGDPSQTKLQAMLQGINSGQAQAPGIGPPTGSQPGGFPRPTDPAARPYAICIRALKNLAQVVGQQQIPGGIEEATRIEEMAVKLQHEFVQRTNRIAKYQQNAAQLGGM